MFDSLGDRGMDESETYGRELVEAKLFLRVGEQIQTFSQHLVPYLGYSSPIEASKPLMKLLAPSEACFHLVFTEDTRVDLVSLALELPKEWKNLFGGSFAVFLDKESCDRVFYLILQC